MSSAPSRSMAIYRLDLREPLPGGREVQGTFRLAERLADVRANLRIWVKNRGWRDALKMALKVLSRRRIFFSLELDQTIIQSGWAHLGFCRHYPVEKDSVVLGDVWTAPAYRGQGLAPAVLQRAMTVLFERGHRRFYIDADVDHASSLRMIEKAGFTYDRSSF